MQAEIAGWRLIAGQEGSDSWVRISPDGKLLLIGEYDSQGKNGVKRTIRVHQIGPVSP